MRNAWKTVYYFVIPWTQVSLDTKEQINMQTILLRYMEIIYTFKQMYLL